MMAITTPAMATRRLGTRMGIPPFFSSASPPVGWEASLEEDSGWEGGTLSLVLLSELEEDEVVALVLEEDEVAGGGVVAPPVVPPVVPPPEVVAFSP